MTEQAETGVVPITTEDVRAAVVRAMMGFWHPNPEDDFDSWLADHDANVWDEGWEASATTFRGHNPYGEPTRTA